MGRRAMSKGAELYTCVHATEFPLQALLRLRPNLREQPCVVMEGEPPLQQVCSLNRRAHGLGMARAMTKVEADTFPSVHRLLRSRGEEAVTKAAMLECVGAFSPRVEDCSEDGAFLCVIDIAGTRALFGPPGALAQNILTRLSAMGLEVSIAVSCNALAAIALAKGLAARTVMVAAGEESAALALLPLTVLDLTAEQAGIFALWGIRTLGMLAALPETQLISRMGQSGKKLRLLARGEMTHLFRPVEPAFTLSEQMELDSPIEVLDALLFVVNLMLDLLIQRAMARVLALASVSIRLTLEGGATHSRSVRPALPTNDRQLWLKLLHLDLEAHPPQAIILAVAVNAEPGATSKVQLGLFSPQLPEPTRLDVTLARIRAIVGDDNAGRAVLTDAHRPDAFRMEPFTVSAVEPSKISAVPLRSALRRLRPAELTFVTLQHERPKTLVFRERRYTVEHAYGPWLTGGEWWSPARWGCEQWDLVARADDGVLLCCSLMRDQLRNEWRIAGLYD
jgi:protein ImuB